MYNPSSNTKVTTYKLGDDGLTMEVDEDSAISLSTMVSLGTDLTKRYAAAADVVTRIGDEASKASLESVTQEIDAYYQKFGSSLDVISETVTRAKVAGLDAGTQEMLSIADVRALRSSAEFKNPSLAQYADKDSALTLNRTFKNIDVATAVSKSIKGLPMSAAEKDISGYYGSARLKTLPIAAKNGYSPSDVDAISAAIAYKEYTKDADTVLKATQPE